MSRRKKKKAKPIALKKPADPERGRRIRRGVLRGLLMVNLLLAVWAGVYFARQYVEQEVVMPVEPPRVVLVNRPVWMSDFLAEQIKAIARPRSPHSVFDHQMLVEAVEKLRASPWIREVRQVRLVYGERPGDTLEVDCEYRAPVAMVRWGDYLWLVDGDGIKLPEQFALDQAERILYGRDGRTNIRIIKGVRRPPPQSGEQWVGEDLKAGLDLVKLLHGRKYAEEIQTVDVSNFEGRQRVQEAWIVLVTKYDTKVLWGRPVELVNPLPEVSAAQKLEHLSDIYTHYGRVDADKMWVDIRYDEPKGPHVSGG